jgi:hypothetical protein
MGDELEKLRARVEELEDENKALKEAAAATSAGTRNAMADTMLARIRLLLTRAGVPLEHEKRALDTADRVAYICERFTRVS